jgi:hypothetical protein
MKNTVIYGAVIVAMFVSVGYVANNALMMPDVQVSYSTKHCVKVVNYADTNFSCENMPSKFNHVWVK